MNERPLFAASRPAPLTSPDGWREASGWRDFFDRLSDPILVIDARGRVAFANTAALRLVPCEPGTPLARLESGLGAEAVRWLAGAATGMAAVPAPPARLADGRSASLDWQHLDDRHIALRLVPAAEAKAAGSTHPLPSSRAAPMRETLRLFWDSPFPATLQDAAFRFVDVNPAFAAFTGIAREALIGRDFLDLVPAEDREAMRANRRRLVESGGDTDSAYVAEGRLVDAGGLERWFRAGRRSLTGDDGAPLYLAVLQDTTTEHVARERADRSVRELDDWFDLSPVGMVLFDESGLLVRTNPAFDEIAGDVPVSLADAAPGLAKLLSWGEGGALERLHPVSHPIASEGWVARPGGAARRLRAFVRCYRTAGGQRRYMGIVEDRSVEEERDVAQMQIGALMDTAGVGVATFEESTGWVRQRPSAAAPGSSSSVLQNISRDLVVAESMPEFERLQLALQRTQRAEVRYAIRHPELGQRWLLTRVEPATLASGKKTASVVTLDISDQEQSQRRSEQLLREMTTILESTSAGIAYLRAGVLVRCNRRFESMLRLSAGGVAGLGLAELLAGQPNAATMAAGIAAALAADATYEIEFSLADGDDSAAGTGAEPDGAGATRWYSLSVRRAGGTAGRDESIAVLADVTRMKTQQVELETLARDRELMFSLSDVGIAFVRDGRIQRANAAMANLTGWPVGELSALDVARLFETDDGARQQAQDERDLRLHGRCGGERQLRRRDGRLIWVQTAMRLVNQGDPAGGIIASYVNIDARHRAERAVALQAERTRSILDSVLVGIVTVGPSGIEWMNRSARRMFGGSLADFVNQPISVVATPEADHPFRRTRYLDELVEGQAETFECRVRARDGREFWVVGNAVVTGRESTGRQLTYALLDIERRRQAEAAVGEAQASLRRVIEAAPLAIALLDARTLKVAQVNEVAARTVRGEREALIGRTPEQIFPAMVAARAPRGHGVRPGDERGDRARVPGRGRRRAAGLGRALRAARRRAGRAARPAPARRHRRHRAARRAGGPLRGGDRAARDAREGSPPPDQEQPAGRRRPAASRSPGASPRSRRRSTRLSARSRRSPMSTACRSAPPARSRSSPCSRRSRARCSAPSGGASAAASAARRRGGRCPRSRRFRSRSS